MIFHTARQFQYFDKIFIIIQKDTLISFCKLGSMYELAYKMDFIEVNFQ